VGDREGRELTMTSVAVATNPIRAQLPPEVQAKIAENRARNAIVAQIRGAVWTKDYSEQIIRAVAEYAYRNGLDPVTEVEILGGRPYKNATYYRRKGADLIAAGVIASIDYDHVSADPRLAEMAAECETFAREAEQAGRADEVAEWRRSAMDARREIIRRKGLRAKHNATEKAAAVVVTTIRLHNGVTVDGCNWCGNGTRAGDPVGNAEPAKTAESRSERRAWMKLIQSEAAQHIPAVAAFAAAERASRDDAAGVEEIIAEEAQQITAGHEAARQKPLTQLPADPYAEPESDAEVTP
jgi:hypothetical protein